jgi:cysteine desulfurase/selenocysteine lyase
MQPSLQSIHPAQIDKWRSDFPILSEQIYGLPLCYLDNAATTQKPRAVIQAVNEFYCKRNSNIHRGVHFLSQESTKLYENTRQLVAGFINAASEKEIIFTRGATESLNMLAWGFGEAFLQEGDEIIISAMEHHANIVPWQILCERKKCKLRHIRFNSNGELDLDHFQSLINSRTRLISVVWISNALGTVNPVEEIIDYARQHGIYIAIDASQAVQHQQVDVQQLDCDFLVFSGHKVYAPSGTGILYGKLALLDKFPPYQSGGDMILRVTLEKSTFAALPARLEAGTPNIEGVIGLGAAIQYLQQIGFNDIASHEDALLDYTTEQLTQIESLRIIGQAAHKKSVISFTLGDIHPHDIGSLLDRQGIAVRAGHHCAQPVMQCFGIPATTRASFAFYNTFHEIDRLKAGLVQIIELFA